MKIIGIFYNNYIDLGETDRPKPEILFPVSKAISITHIIPGDIDLSKPTTTRLVFKYIDAGREFVIYEFKGEME